MGTAVGSSSPSLLFFLLKGSKKQCTCRKQSNDDRNILRQFHIESFNLWRFFGLIKVGGET